MKTSPSRTSQGASPASSQPTRGTKLGWTFWSAAAKCWRYWALKYLVGITLPPRKELVRGTVYHALHEGVEAKTIMGWGPAYAEALPEAQELFDKRINDGPPLPVPISVEVERRVLGASMTSRPDREEVPGWEEGETGVVRETAGIRDFKTTSYESKHADLEWAVSGTIIGQLVATKNSLGTVDVMNVKTGKTKLYEVRLDAAKESALRGMIGDLEESLVDRLGRAAKGVDADSTFPANLTQCVGKYGPCDFYAHCWGSKLDKLKYQWRAPSLEWAGAMGLGNVVQAARAGLLTRFK